MLADLFTLFLLIGNIGLLVYGLRLSKQTGELIRTLQSEVAELESRPPPSRPSSTITPTRIYSRPTFPFPRN